MNNLLAKQGRDRMGAVELSFWATSLQSVCGFTAEERVHRCTDHPL